MNTLSRAEGDRLARMGGTRWGRVWKEDGVSEVSEGAGPSGDRHAADAPRR